ncbi:DUF3221 domain-containing protein [Jeotgalibacillus haloalkalitolerans]|uniref:DUF3221 domain-containing protein n=1 Tax=Jeotgalibacillus haloalkalitolerans TaxID=3104292 RepID=A0ABU5KHC7_9BACL|nr:DUF3221 domain-containing protein [Jeotgalibacillus sp. HH7-29]MDZ5710637.1 DUF3221 domain-containing protein [Jeotgalibacillus sp. HH7-29]
MPKLYTVLAIMVLLTIAGCSGPTNSNEHNHDELETETVSFTGTIREINGKTAIVSAVLSEGNPESNVFVDLSVNQDETFQVGDIIKVEYDGAINESNPAQINTLSVEHAE